MFEILRIMKIVKAMDTQRRGGPHVGSNHSSRYRWNPERRPAKTQRGRPAIEPRTAKRRYEQVTVDQNEPQPPAQRQRQDVEMSMAL
jgi:hypothetical protein